MASGEYWPEYELIRESPWFTIVLNVAFYLLFYLRCQIIISRSNPQMDVSKIIFILWHVIYQFVYEAYHFSSQQLMDVSVGSLTYKNVISLHVIYEVHSLSSLILRNYLVLMSCCTVRIIPYYVTLRRGTFILLNLMGCICHTKLCHWIKKSLTNKTRPADLITIGKVLRRLFWSLYNFVHTKTAQLPWYLQNFIVTWVIGKKIERNIFQPHLNFLHRSRTLNCHPYSTFSNWCLQAYCMGVHVVPMGLFLCM